MKMIRWNLAILVMLVGIGCDDGKGGDGECEGQTNGTACGDDAATDCDNPDTCHDGECVKNYDAADMACDDIDTDCRSVDTCDGAGNCIDNGLLPMGSGCGAGDGCEHSCDASGNCTGGQADEDELCGSSVDNDCTEADTCDDSGNCVTHDEDEGTECGDDSDSDCTDPDTCDGEGTCAAHNEEEGTDCGEEALACYEQDECDSHGECEHHTEAIEGCTISITGSVTPDSGDSSSIVPKGGGPTGIMGAIVSIPGSNPLITDTTDANGIFTLTNIPPRTTNIILIQVAPKSGSGPSDSYLGLVTPVEINGVETELEDNVGLLTEENVADVADALHVLQPSFTYDSSKGIVDVQFRTLGNDEYVPDGGETVQISKVSALRFTFASPESDTPVISDELLEGGSSELIFANTVTGNTQLMNLMQEALLCEIPTEITQWPVAANTITEAVIECKECSDSDLDACPDDENECTDPACSDEGECMTTPIQNGTPCGIAMMCNNGSCVPNIP